MKLWLLKPIDPAATYVNDYNHRIEVWGDCDSAYGFVVRATDAKKARELASKQAGDEGAATWLDPKLTSCRQLTVRGAAEVVLRDFVTG